MSETNGNNIIKVTEIKVTEIKVTEIKVTERGPSVIGTLVTGD